MVSNGSIVHIDFVGSEICVIPENRLGSVQSSLGGYCSLAFFWKNRNATISSGKLCAYVAGLIVDQDAKWRCGETGVSFDLPISSPALTRY